MMKQFFLPFALLLAVASSRPVAAQAVITQNFTGFSNADCPKGLWCGKPDSSGAVGPVHFVELVNNHYAAYRKSDGFPVQSCTADDFWTRAGITFASKEHELDPQLLYDQAARRWYAAAINDINDSGDNENGSNADQGRDLLFAVSRSSDPTLGWSGFRIHLNTTHESPSLGINRDGVYIRVTEFQDANNPDVGHNGPYTAHTFLVFPKTDLLASTPSIARMTNITIPAPYLISSAGGWPRPVVDMDNAGMPEILIGVSAPNVFGVFKRSNILGPVTAPTLDTGAGYPDMFFFGNTNYGIAPPAPQPDPKTAPIDVGYPAHQSPAFMINGEIWSVLNAADDGSGRGTIHWLRMSATKNTIIEEGFIGDPELTFFYPSIAVNGKGDVVIGCNGSGPNTGQYASSYALVGKTSGGRTTFGKPMLLKAGIANYQPPADSTIASWGDWSTTTLDPEDPYTFWTIQQWASGQTTWSTQITALTIVH